jgi:hypothetical protein
MLSPKSLCVIALRALSTLVLPAFWAGSAAAQPLPKIELTLVFPKLQVRLPDGMVEAPDGSGRFFILEQDGRIIVVRKGSDGSQAGEFLNIVDRKPRQPV